MKIVFIITYVNLRGQIQSLKNAIDEKPFLYFSVSDLPFSVHFARSAEEFENKIKKWS